MPLNIFDPNNVGDWSGLQGRSVLITGGASGLGASTARLLAKNGAHVTIADLQDGQPLADELTEVGHTMRYVPCDVTDYDSQIAAFESATEFSQKGELDAVLAFAGVGGVGTLVDHVTASDGVPAPPSTKTIDVNVKGVLYTATLALHYLGTKSPDKSKDDKAKSLTIVASMAAFVDDTHNTAYTVSKFALRGLVRALRGSASSQLGVRVNALCPWAMRTPMTEPILQHLASVGINAGEGKGITLVEHEVLTKAAARIVLDASVWGRCVAIMPEGAVDLEDDFEGGYASAQLVELMGLRKEAGDFLRS